MKLLLVDDSQTMRRIQRTQLNGLGITDIIEASHGEEALAVLKAQGPVDAMMLDWNMPVMDGFTLLTKLRAMPEYKEVKIIMCTSESEKSKVVEAIKAGANNYLIKPFTPESLKEKLGI
jgi:two-component system chemotaxis response regulator CheY